MTMDLTPKQVLEGALAKTKAEFDLTPQQMLLARIQAGFEYEEFQEPVIEWFVNYCQENNLADPGYMDATTSWGEQTNHQIFQAIDNILEDEEKALELSQKMSLGFNKLRESLYPDLPKN